jgi:hypothetical protein
MGRATFGRLFHKHFFGHPDREPIISCAHAQYKNIKHFPVTIDKLSTKQIPALVNFFQSCRQGDQMSWRKKSQEM